MNQGKKKGEMVDIQFGNMFSEVTVNDIEVCKIEQGRLENDNQNNDNNIVTDNKYYYDAKKAAEEDKNVDNMEEEVGENLTVQMITHYLKNRWMSKISLTFSRSPQIMQGHSRSSQSLREERLGLKA